MAGFSPFEIQIAAPSSNNYVKITPTLSGAADPRPVVKWSNGNIPQG
jgi:hypothetical protein